jgi:hypothetical protein
VEIDEEVADKYYYTSSGIQKPITMVNAGTRPTFNTLLYSTVVTSHVPSSA